MRNLLEDYLAEVVAHLGLLSPEQRAEELREVQDHLENAVAAMRESGTPEAEAVVAVLEQFGQAKMVARGFVAAWRRGENKRKGIVMKERIFFGTSLAMVTLGAAWLMFVAMMISHTLFPKGQILIHASEGASLQVRQGVVQVLSAGSNGAGVEAINGPLLTAFVSVPFLLIVGFAVVGCCSLLRVRRIAG